MQTTNKHIANTIASAACALSIGLTAGCGGMEDDAAGFQGVVARYVQHYRSQHPYTDHWIVRGEHRLAARHFAPAEPASGPPVVLMHGYPDSQHLYDAVVPLLRQEREVVTFDFLGWGASDKPAPDAHRYDAASLRTDLEVVMAHFGFENSVLVVHDASGWPGIDWALDHPERVAALVILNTVYHPTETARPPEGLAQFAVPGSERDALIARMSADDRLWLDGSAVEGIFGFRDQIGRFFDRAKARDEFLPVLAAESLSMRPAFFALAGLLFDEVRARVAAVPRMQAFQPPVSVAFGIDDPYLNSGVAGDFAAKFPNSRRIDIAGANHYVQLDRPSEVAKVILEADSPIGD
jgi:haloalkane dehalogenase